MAHKHSPSWVIPECLKSLKLHESILEATEGIGWDVLIPLKDLIKRLEHLQREHDAEEVSNG